MKTSSSEYRGQAPVRRSLVSRTEAFGTLPTGEIIQQYHLENALGTVAKLINYGATLTSLTLIDHDQQPVVVTLGFDTLQEYLTHPYYFGCTVGRVANRIAHGKFRYQDKFFQLSCNENPASHLHGGNKGFDKVVWNAKIIEKEDRIGVEFSYFSPDGEEGYPGNLKVSTTYYLTNTNELTIAYSATTDQPTALSLTNHTYWNLAGTGTILDHELQIMADQFLETDAMHLPTGKISSVTETDYDFREPQRIGARIHAISGYDNYYILSDETYAARVSDRVSGRSLTIYTTQLGMQFYSGNYLPKPWTGFCLETQGYPDAVNHAHFPSIILLPGEVYSHETKYQLCFSSRAG
jgi:aldose 1-epimerase